MSSALFRTRCAALVVACAWTGGLVSPACAGILGNAGAPLAPSAATGTGMASGKGRFGPPAPADVAAELGEGSWSNPPAEVSVPLMEAVRIAAARHPGALAAQAQFRAATSDVSGAWWQRFPSVSTQLAYGNLNQQERAHGASPTVVVDLPLWAGGKLDATQNRARAQQWVAYMALNQTLVDLAINVSQAYFEVLRQTRRVALLSESVTAHEQLVETMARRVRQEISPAADLELARSRVAQIRQEADAADAQRKSAQRALAELTGDESGFVAVSPVLPTAVKHDWSQAEADALGYDPGLRRQSALADVAKAEEDLTRSGILPQVSAQYSYNELYGSRVGVVLKMQSAGGLSQISATSSAKMRVQGAIEQIGGLRRQVRQQINADIIENTAAQARLLNGGIASVSAARVKDSYMRQFIAGRRSWLDVMNSLREAVSARLGEVDAAVSASASAVKIAIRSGAWRPFNDRSSEQP